MKEFFVWCRDKGGSFVTTSWLYITLWGIVAAAFATLLYMDGKFSRSLAEGASIDPLAFQVIGWCFRFFAVVFLVAVARNVHKGISKGRTFQVLGVFVSVIVCLHAVGIGLEALDDKKDRALAVETTVAAQTDGIDEKLAALERQKEGIRSDLERTVASNNAAIENITSDGLNNDELADVYRQDNAEASRLARERIADIDAVEMQLLTQGASVAAENASVVATADKWSPLFIGIAQLATMSREPSDWAIYLCGVFFIVFWVAIAESLVIFVPPAIYRMHLHDADHASVKHSERAKKGWQTRKRKQRRKARLVGASGYYTQKIPAAMEYVQKYSRGNLAGMANTVFGSGMTVGEMMMIFDQCLEHGHLSAEDHKYITTLGCRLKDEQQKINGQDHNPEGDSHADSHADGD
ncbi:MAG: hypothetical protein AAGF20_00740 [Pseudomonadota bacterium]